jgi:hypothetical protein
MGGPDVRMQYGTVLEASFRRVLQDISELTPRLRRVDRLVIYRVYPSFDDGCAWQVHRETDSGRIGVRRVRVDREATWARVEGLMVFREDLVPRPVVEVTDGWMGVPQWEELAAAARRITLPIIVPKSNRVGLDGTTHELSSGDFMGSLGLRWWENGPEEWDKLQWWVEDFRRACEGALTAQ